MPLSPSMNVIALRVDAVETKPGSKVKYPVSLLSLPMSSAGSPRLPLTIGNTVDLLDAESVNTTLWSDTACSLKKKRCALTRAGNLRVAASAERTGATTQNPRSHYRTGV